MTSRNTAAARAIGAILPLLLLGCLSRPAFGAETPAQRAARVQRFDGFLKETMALYAKAGARPEKSVARFGYADADLIDPMVVTGERRHVLERYASYRAMLATKRVGAGPAAFARPSGSSTPEDHDWNAGSGRGDDTAAIEQALAAGNVWLTPGRVYRVSHPIAVPSNRVIASDGTGTILVVAGGAGFPQRPFDPAADRNATPDVFQVHDVQQVVLRDFRLQTPIAQAGVPEAILHGIDVRNASHVDLAGLELRGFPRSQGILRVNSSSDVTIEDDLIHASYTRVLTRQVTGIEVDESRVRPRAGLARRSSDHIRILDNFIFGLVLDPAVYLDTTLRGGKPLNDETTGIQLAAAEPATTIEVSGNLIADVGQGLDLFVSNGRFSNNVIERASEFGLKMGHSASNNVFDRFIIRASGLAAVTIYGMAGEAATGNRITNLRIDHPGAVNGLPGASASAIMLNVVDRSDPKATGASVSGNLFDTVAITGIPAGAGKAWRATIDCRWPAAGTSGAQPNRFVGITPSPADVESIGGCAVTQ